MPPSIYSLTSESQKSGYAEIAQDCAECDYEDSLNEYMSQL